jgi:hypothetical protein
MRAKRRKLLQERLSGIEFRNRQRSIRRRLIQVDSLERRRTGTTREYYFDKEKRA